MNLSASMSLLDPARRLVEITITFFHVILFLVVFFPYWFVLNSIAKFYSFFCRVLQVYGKFSYKKWGILVKALQLFRMKGV